MKLDLLTAISPIDGRYRGKTERLADYFSEYALIRYRVRVEIEYFITLCELPLPQLASFDHQLFDHLRDIYRNFGEEEAQRVKDIEKVTNHDVKAVEYFIRRSSTASVDSTLTRSSSTSDSLLRTSTIHQCPSLSRRRSSSSTTRSARSSSHSSASMQRSGQQCLCSQRHTDSPLRPHVWARR